MSIFQSVAAVQVVFVLGIVNIVSGLLVFFTCRCMPGARLTVRISGNLMKYAFYRRIYGYHCYIWWVFWGSVMVHAVFAIGSIGFPF